MDIEIINDTTALEGLEDFSVSFIDLFPDFIGMNSEAIVSIEDDDSKL